MLFFAADITSHRTSFRMSSSDSGEWYDLIGNSEVCNIGFRSTRDAKKTKTMLRKLFSHTKRTSAQKPLNWGTGFERTPIQERKWCIVSVLKKFDLGMCFNGRLMSPSASKKKEGWVECVGVGVAVGRCVSGEGVASPILKRTNIFVRLSQQASEAIFGEKRGGTNMIAMRWPTYDEHTYTRESACRLRGFVWLRHVGGGVGGGGRGGAGRICDTTQSTSLNDVSHARDFFWLMSYSKEDQHR